MGTSIAIQPAVSPAASTPPCSASSSTYPQYHSDHHGLYRCLPARISQVLARKSGRIHRRLLPDGCNRDSHLRRADLLRTEGTGVISEQARVPEVRRGESTQQAA